MYLTPAWRRPRVKCVFCGSSHRVFFSFPFQMKPVTSADKTPASLVSTPPSQPASLSLYSAAVRSTSGSSTCVPYPASTPAVTSVPAPTPVQENSQNVSAAHTDLPVALLNDPAPPTPALVPGDTSRTSFQPPKSLKLWPLRRDPTKRYRKRARTL